MPTHNIVLIPSDPTLSAIFTELAQKHFTDIADVYLLGANALPHITLAQFTAKNDEDAIKAFSSLDLPNRFEADVVSFTESIHAYKRWVAFDIKKEDGLMGLQKIVYNHLSQKEMSPVQTPETYSPHVTMGRLKEAPKSSPKLEDLPMPHRYKFYPAVGISTDIGVYVRTLKS